MSNSFTLGGANVVVLARNYNPSIVSKEWLYEKSIVKEAVTSFIHTPPLSVVEAEQISFILDENRFQISLKGATTENIGVLPKIAIDFVSYLPETPFVAVGFNYKYHMQKENSLLKKLFQPDDSRLRSLFSENYDVGQIVSFAFGEFVVRMSAPPEKDESAKVIVELNFHSDCRGVDEVKERLGMHRVTMKKAEEILRGLSK